jgi:hypothetical protein
LNPLRERTEVRRVELLLSESQVPEWQELAGEGPVGVGKDVEEHPDMEIVQIDKAKGELG